jgi:hypothetical protein
MTHILDTTKPAVENIRSVGTEVAGTVKYFLRILDMAENFDSMCIRFNFELVNSCMHFFFTDYSNKTKYPNIDSIEYYSLESLFFIKKKLIINLLLEVMTFSIHTQYIYSFTLFKKLSAL